MGSFTLTQTSPATPNAVWNVLDDFANISQYASGVASSDPINDIASGTGAERMCTFDAKGEQWVKERVTLRDDNQMVIDVYETNAPMKRLEGTIRVTPAGSDSQISMTMDMQVKGGPLGPIMEVALVRPNFKKAVRQLLADIDQAARN